MYLVRKPKLPGSRVLLEQFSRDYTGRTQIVLVVWNTFPRSHWLDAHHVPGARWCSHAVILSAGRRSTTIRIVATGNPQHPFNCNLILALNTNSDNPSAPLFQWVIPSQNSLDDPGTAALVQEYYIISQRYLVEVTSLLLLLVVAVQLDKPYIPKLYENLQYTLCHTVALRSFVAACPFGLVYS